MPLLKKELVDSFMQKSLDSYQEVPLQAALTQLKPKLKEMHDNGWSAAEIAATLVVEFHTKQITQQDVEKVLGLPITKVKKRAAKGAGKKGAASAKKEDDGAKAPAGEKRTRQKPAAAETPKAEPAPEPAPAPAAPPPKPITVEHVDKWYEDENYVVTQGKSHIAVGTKIFLQSGKTATITANEPTKYGAFNREGTKLSYQPD